MDLYADDLTDYIYQENDVAKRRALLLYGAQNEA